MQTPSSPPQEAESKGGFPIWTAIVLLFVLVIVVLCGLGAGLYYLRSSRQKADRVTEQLKAMQAENELAAAKMVEATKLTIARNRQEDLLRTVRRSTNELGSLSVLVTTLNRDMMTLRMSDEGKTVAAFPDLVAQARRFYETDSQNIPSVSDVNDRLEGARRVEQQLVNAAGTSFEPDAALSSSTEETLSWAQSEKKLCEQDEALLTYLRRESKVKLRSADSSNFQSLDEAMKVQSATDLAERNSTILNKTKEARNSENQSLAQAEADRIAAEARAKKTASDLQTKQVLDESQKAVLREKASRADVQQKLSAYLTAGYYNPTSAGGGDTTYDKKPMSFSRLREIGALDTSMKGLRIFISVGVNIRNDRPRLSKQFLYAWWTNPTLMDEAKSLQQSMLELGPSFVDLGLMEK